MTSRRRDIERMFLSRRHCDCGCGRYADVVRPPIGWRAKRLPDDRTKWRALALAYAEAEHSSILSAA